MATDPNAEASNTPKINKIIDYLKLIREAGELPIGWEPGQVPPPSANALASAGLVVLEGTPGRRTVKPAADPYNEKTS